MLYRAAVGIDKVELQSAELRTGTAVGAPSEAVLRGIAHARIAHAERTVHKHLEFHVGHVAVDGGNLLQTQLAGEHHAPETPVAQPSHFRRRAVVGLGGSMIWGVSELGGEG